MTKKAWFIAGFASVVTLGAFAAANSPLPSASPTDASCIARMPAGKYQGLCLDLSEFRTVSRLSEEERRGLSVALGDSDLLDPRFEVISNFGYGGKFWKAIIPTERIHNIVYEQVILLPNLPFKISHSQLRFQLSPDGVPIRLIDESDPSTPREIEVPKGVGNDDLIFALWAVRAQGHQEKFNPIHGAVGDYAATYALQGLQDGTGWTQPSKFPVHQYAVQLDPEKSRAALGVALTLATARGITYMYDTRTNSCSNATFDVLKKVFYNEDNPGDTELERAEKFLQSADPVGQLEKLRMLDLSVSLPDLDVELAQRGKAR